MCDRGVARAFHSTIDRDRHQALMPRLAHAGLCPRILHMDGWHLCLERCESFSEWHRKASESELGAMRTKVIGLIQDLHAAGVCHRDLHEDNLVFKSGRPLVIDLEYACAVDPTGPCYDLYGPSEGHQGRLFRHWWDSPTGGLHDTFGPLHPGTRSA
jgi:serine/threonine protein kinase